jgi:hypothetical protein
MIPVKHIDPDDLALYAMQLLPPEEMEEMRLNLQHSAEARKVLAEYASDLSLFAHTADLHSPAAATRERFLKAVAKEKKVIPAQPEPVETATITPRDLPSIYDFEVKKRSLASRTLPWVGWAIAAGLLVPLFNTHQEQEHLRDTLALEKTLLEKDHVNTELINTLMGKNDDPTAVHARLTSTGTPPPPQGRASYVAEKGALLFVANNLQPLQPMKTYELWVVPKTEGQAPIPAGTFKPDALGNASVIMPLLPKGVEAKAFAVTIEDDGGSSIPTAPLILQGVAAS